MLIYTIIGLFVFYSVLLIWCWIGWRSLPVFKSSRDGSISISIIIPARNEENNIGNLLQCIEEQDYPVDLFEVIVIDDHSTDKTAQIVKQFPRVKLLQLAGEQANSYKKMALSAGINAAKNELIVTTDADCMPGNSWLSAISSFKSSRNAAFIAGPVFVRSNSSLLQTFQSMDFMILQGITGAALHYKKLSMCNGANLAYEKVAFTQVGGFDGIDAIASGDDMLLLNKIRRVFPDGIFYLKSRQAIVETAPMLTWKSFFHQRIRWASKAMKYDDKRIFPVLLLVYLFNCSFALLLIAGIWNPVYWIYFLIFWGSKTLVELPLFVSLTQFFNVRWSPLLFFIFQPLHIFYTIISGTFGQLGRYEWKGRRVR